MGFSGLEVRRLIHLVKGIPPMHYPYMLGFSFVFGPIRKQSTADDTPAKYKI
jgi:hypothetical protein